MDDEPKIDQPFDNDASRLRDANRRHSLAFVASVAAHALILLGLVFLVPEIERPHHDWVLAYLVEFGPSGGGLGRGAGVGDAHSGSSPASAHDGTTAAMPPMSHPAHRHAAHPEASPPRAAREIAAIAAPPVPGEVAIAAGSGARGVRRFGGRLSLRNRGCLHDRKRFIGGNGRRWGCRWERRWGCRRWLRVRVRARRLRTEPRSQLSDRGAAAGRAGYGPATDRGWRRRFRATRRGGAILRLRFAGSECDGNGALAMAFRCGAARRHRGRELVPGANSVRIDRGASELTELSRRWSLFDFLDGPFLGCKNPCYRRNKASMESGVWDNG